EQGDVVALLLGEVCRDERVEAVEDPADLAERGAGKIVPVGELGVDGGQVAHQPLDLEVVTAHGRGDAGAVHDALDQRVQDVLLGRRVRQQVLGEESVRLGDVASQLGDGGGADGVGRRAERLDVGQ